MGTDASLRRLRSSVKRELPRRNTGTTDRELFMRTILRRIAALEKSRSVISQVSQGIPEKALDVLHGDRLEPLIRSYGADRMGQPHTEAEAAARRPYDQEFERLCRLAGLLPTTAPTLDIHKAFIRVLACRLTTDELQLCLSGMRAAREGREPTAPESAAMQAADRLWGRLNQLVGLGTLPEFETVRIRGSRRND